MNDMKPTLSRHKRSFGATSAMYRLWNATPELFTSFAKMPSACRDLTNFAIASGELDTVTLSALLWQAGTTSGGQRALVSSQLRPKMDKNTL